jgi:tRNA (cytidine/uridine-2'-O-)-methyltransferase
MRFWPDKHRVLLTEENDTIINNRRIIMQNLNIVLVEPQIPQNTGNISRTCAVTGARLHLVRPLGFEVSDKHLKRAGLDYWDKLDITYYDSLADFFEKNKDGHFFYFTTKGLHVHSEAEYPDNAYLVFGREDKGLPEELLHDNPESCVRIPMRNELRSLNLSNSVAIAVYEVLRQWDYPDLSREGKLTKYEW